VERLYPNTPFWAALAEDATQYSPRDGKENDERRRHLLSRAEQAAMAPVANGPPCAVA